MYIRIKALWLTRITRSCRPHKKQKLDFHTRGTELIILQEVEVHGWLLSGSEELFAALF